MSCNPLWSICELPHHLLEFHRDRTIPFHQPASPPIVFILFEGPTGAMDWLLRIFQTDGVIWKKDEDRRKGKSRRFCLGGRMYSIPYRTCYFAQDDYEE